MNDKKTNKSGVTSDKSNPDRLIKKGYITVIAGPCAIESWEQFETIARVVRDCGLSYMRGGAYKPRTSPYSFQGLEHKGLEYLVEIKNMYGLKTVTEVTDAETVEEVAKYVDVLQIGTRNMSNFALLKKVSKVVDNMEMRLVGLIRRYRHHAGLKPREEDLLERTKLHGPVIPGQENGTAATQDDVDSLLKSLDM